LPPAIGVGSSYGRHLADAQRRAEAWCRTTAGLRVHGTTQRRPAEVFAAEEQPRLLAAPQLPYDLPVYVRPKVARDHHVEVAKALYSVPGHLIGHRIEARADAQLVKLFWRGALIKMHPRQPGGGRASDPAESARASRPLRVAGHRLSVPPSRHPRALGRCLCPPGCSRSTCPGPACGTSTDCWATPAATATAAATPRAPKPSPWMSSTSG
jgi:hypothetical protein